MEKRFDNAGSSRIKEREDLHAKNAEFPNEPWEPTLLNVVHDGEEVSRSKTMMKEGRGRADPP